MNRKKSLRSKSSSHATTEEEEFDFFLEEGEDPINRLGYGLVSYFSMIKTLMIFYGVLTLLNIPNLYNNSTWDAFSGEPMAFMTKFTIGNMGQSSQKCMHSILAGDAIYLGCNTGTITDIKHFGIYSNNSPGELAGQCAPSTFYDMNNKCTYLSETTNDLYKKKLQPCLG